MPIDADNVGKRMLEKMGYKPGQGLGKEEQGRSSPIDVKSQAPSVKKGLGWTAPTPAPPPTAHAHAPGENAGRKRAAPAADSAAGFEPPAPTQWSFASGAQGRGDRRAREREEKVRERAKRFKRAVDGHDAERDREDSWFDREGPEVGPTSANPTVPSAGRRSSIPVDTRHPTTTLPHQQDAAHQYAWTRGTLVRIHGISSDRYVGTLNTVLKI